MGTANRYVDFVSDAHFLCCVKYVCSAYPIGNSKAEIKDLTRNSLDLFKMLFDMLTSNKNVGNWIIQEKIRQSDKTISNKVGEFHQKLLGGVSGWQDLPKGNPLGIDLKKNDNSIFIELKNKHNTVKGEDLKNVFDKLKKIADKYPNAIIYYAYVIPKKPTSGEEIWRTSKREPNKRVKVIWGYRLYELVTGDKYALQKVWDKIPLAISDLLKPENNIFNEEKKELINLFHLTFGKNLE